MKQSGRIPALAAAATPSLTLHPRPARPRPRSQRRSHPAVGPRAKVKVVAAMAMGGTSQFAGYFAAKNKGYDEEEGLDVTSIMAGPDIAAQMVASGAAEFAVAGCPAGCSRRARSGAKLVNIAQIFQRSGTLMVSFKDKNITKPEDLKGKKLAHDSATSRNCSPPCARSTLILRRTPKIIKQGFDMSRSEGRRSMPRRP